MGNANNGGDGSAALLVIDQPLVSDLQPYESIVARAELQGKVYTIDQWPADPLVVEQLSQGSFRCSFYAVNEDNPDESEREFGEVVLSYECIKEYFVQTEILHLWLRLMDRSQVPVGQLSSSEVLDVFGASFDEAGAADASKVSISIAAVSKQVLAEKEVEGLEDLDLIHHLASRNPVMNLLTQNEDIIKGYYNAFTGLNEDLNVQTRDFASKEKLYQGFVVTNRTQKIEMLTRFGNCKEIVAKKWGDLVIWTNKQMVMAAWTNAVKDAKQSRFDMELIQKMNTMEMLQMKFNKLSNMQMMFSLWCRVQMRTVLDQFNVNAQFKVGISFKVATVDFGRAPNKLLADIEACIQEVLMTTISRNENKVQTPRGGTWNLGDHWRKKPIEAKHFNIAFSIDSPSGDGAVECAMGVPRGRSVSAVRASLGSAPELSAALTEKLMQLPGVKQVCSGDVEGLRVYDLHIFTLRMQMSLGHKDTHFNAVLKGLERSWKLEEILAKTSLVHAWRAVVDQAQKQAREDVERNLQEHLAETMRQKHEENLAKTRHAMVTMFTGTHEHMHMRATFAAWKDMHFHVTNTRREKQQRAEAFTMRMASASASAVLHKLLLFWKEQAVATRQLKIKDQEVAAKEAEYERHLEKTLNQWNNHNQDVCAHIVVREWAAYIAEQKNIYQRAVDLEKHQRTKEHYDNKIGYAVLQLEASNDGFNTKFYFKAWKDVTQEGILEKQLGSVAAQAQALKQFHKDGMMKAMLQVAAADEGSFMHAIFSGWRQWLEELKDLQQMEDRFAEEAKGFHGVHVQQMEKALSTWGSSNKDLLLHTVMHAWERGVSEMKMDRERAEALARQQAAKDKHHQKVGFVLCKMEDENNDFMLQLIFETWHDMTVKDLIGDLTGEVDRMKELHSSSMQNILAKTAAVDDIMVLQMVVSGWKEALWERKRMDDITAHLRVVKDTNDIVVDKALLNWEGEQKDLLLHVVTRRWHLEAQKMKQSQKEAEGLAAKRRAKEMYDDKVMHVLNKMESENATFLMSAAWRLWRDMIEDARLERHGVDMQALSANAERIKMLHKASVRSSMQKLAAANDEMALHAALATWHEYTKDLINMRHTAKRLGQKEERSDHMIDKASMLWARNHIEIAADMMIRRWHEMVLESKDLLGEAERLAAKRRAKEMYDYKIMGVLVKMEADNNHFLTLAAFRTWHDMIDELALAQMEAELTRRGFEITQISAQADRMRQLHKGPVRRSMYKIADMNDDVIKKAILGVWREYMLDFANTRRTAKRLAEKEEKHDRMIDKAMMQWGGNNDILSLHIIMHAWMQDTVEERLIREAALQTNRALLAADARQQNVIQQAVYAWGNTVDMLQLYILLQVWKEDLIREKEIGGKAKYLADLRRKKEEGEAQRQFILGKLAEADSGAWVHALFQAWHINIKEGLHGNALRNLEWGLNHLMGIHAGPVHSLMNRFVLHVDTMSTQCIMSVWREFVQEQKTRRRTRGLVDDAKARHQFAMEKAALTWNSENAEVVLRSTLNGWIRVMFEQKEWRAKAALQSMTGVADRLKHLNKTGVGTVVNRAALSTDSVRLQGSIAAWKAMIAELKIERKLDQTYGKIDRAHLSIFQTFICVRIRRSFIAWRQAWAISRRESYQEFQSESQAEKQELGDQLARLQHQLAVQLLAAEHHVESYHQHSHYLGSCVDDLRGETLMKESAITCMEKELEEFEAVIKGLPQMKRAS